MRNGMTRRGIARSKRVGCGPASQQRVVSDGLEMLAIKFDVVG